MKACQLDRKHAKYEYQQENSDSLLALAAVCLQGKPYRVADAVRGVGQSDANR